MENRKAYVLFIGETQRKMVALYRKNFGSLNELHDEK